MIILLKKALRDLLRHKLRTFAIITAIILSVGLGMGMVNATRDAYETFDKRFDDTNYEDIDIHFDMSALNLTEIEGLDGVETAVGRLYIPTQVEFDDKKYEAHWISAPYHDNEPYSRINGYQIFRGKYISSREAGECLVGNLFADANGISPGDDVTVFHANMTFSLNVTATVGSPEYLYVVTDAGWPQPTLLIPIFTTYEMAREKLHLAPATYNELLVKVKEGYEPEEVKENIEKYLIEKGIRITRSLLGTEELDYQFSRADADGMEKMGWAFGLIILCVTSVVIYNTMSRIIASERPYIGVMSALGGKRSRILLHYSLFGFIMGLVGSILGVLLGIGVSALIVHEYSAIIGLADPVYTVFWTYAVIFAGLGIFLTTLASLLGSLRILSIGPKEAMTSQYNTESFSRKPILERLLGKYVIKNRIFPRIPMRSIARHKLRTGITVIALALSLILVFSILALMLGFEKPIEKNYSDYETWDVQVSLANHTNRGDTEDELRNLAEEGISGEVHFNEHLPVMIRNRMEFVNVQAFKSDSELRHFNVIEGRYEPYHGVLVGSILADHLEVEPGSTLTFVIGNRTSDVMVTGITGELIDASVLMSLDFADEHSLTDGMINSIILDMRDMSRNDTESLVRDSFPVASFSYTRDVKNGMSKMLEGLLAMFVVFIGFCITAEVLFVSTTVVLNILNREMEFISLRAIGARPARIRWMIISESILLLAGSLVIGLPLGRFVTQWTMSYLVGDLMYYALEIDLIVYVLTAAIAAASTIISSYVSSLHITKQKLADTIRHRITT